MADSALLRNLPNTTTPPRPRARWRWAVRGLVVLAAAWFAWRASQVLVGANFHTVIPGRVYRGAQPSPQKLDALARDYGIRTVVNLRGGSPPHAWYVESCRAAQRLGLSLEDIGLSAMRLPSTEELRRLLQILDHADYPIYLHCRRGADRTGLAAAIVLLLDTDATLDTAIGQLSWQYGHVPFGKTAVLDRFVGLYNDWLQERGEVHAPERFRRWLLAEYRGGWCSYAWEELAPLAGVERVSRPVPNETAEPGYEARVGAPISFRARVRNTGTTAWQFRSGRLAGVHFGVFVHDHNLKLVAEVRSALLDKEVPPGESFEALVIVPPIKTPGPYRLLVDLVEEKHCWFYQIGAEPKELELTVRH